MTPATVTDLLRNAFLTTFWIGLPVLAAGFVVGILRRTLHEAGYRSVSVYKTPKTG